MARWLGTGTAAKAGNRYHIPIPSFAQYNIVIHTHSALFSGTDSDISLNFGYVSKSKFIYAYYTWITNPIERGGMNTSVERNTKRLTNQIHQE
uniref:TonB-dependent receptor n=1 Tax=Steinernema glaseri TaxID=37863 RepID=A0A1I7ZGP3_9BILA